MKMPLSILPVLLSLLLIGCNPAKKERVVKVQEEQPEEIRFLPEMAEPGKRYVRSKQRAIHKYYKAHLNPNYFSGMFLVAKNGKLIYEQNSGYTNYRQRRLIDHTTPIHVASISKVATALAVLRLVDQKKIRLDADVRKYLPELPYEGVTVRMLLNHRSGIPYYGYFTYHTWHLGKTLRNDDILKLLREHKFPLNFPPGKKFAYCNTNYALLALIIERVSGKPFPQMMKELVFEPLEMKYSFILDDSFNRDSISQSYKSTWAKEKFDYLDAVYGDKNLYTTARDLMRMDLGTYSSDFISDSLREQMFSGYSYERRGENNYGLGIRMKEKEGRSTYYFHTGWWHGNTGCYSSLRADTVCIIAISNRYTQSVFTTGRLANEFGNYPFNYE